MKLNQTGNRGSQSLFRRFFRVFGGNSGDLGGELLRVPRAVLVHEVPPLKFH